jgi:hypothetical protein
VDQIILYIIYSMSYLFSKTKTVSVVQFKILHRQKNRQTTLLASTTTTYVDPNFRMRRKKVNLITVVR